MRLGFDKIEAAGNDFLLLMHTPDDGVVAAICDRHHGVGADGVMVFRGAGDGRVHLDHFDCDGSRSFCLNGIRAALPCLYRKGAIPVAGTVWSEGMTLPYSLTEEARLTLPIRPVTAMSWRGRVAGWTVDAGNPQLVLRDPPSLETFRTLAREIRSDLDTFPEGTNVCRLERMGDLWHVETFERGVEDLTLACGSGIYACALVLIAGGEAGPLTFQPRGRGRVTVTTAGDRLFFEGTTRHVAEGAFSC